MTAEASVSRDYLNRPFSHDGVPLPASGLGGHGAYKQDIPTQRTAIDRMLILGEVPNIKEYLRAHNNERRFDFENPKHKKTLEYINGPDGKSGCYEDFKVKTDGDLEQLMDEYGVSSIDAVRKKMMNNGKSAPIIRGKMVVPFDHHMPGKGHYNGDFFYWDNLWSVEWAAMQNDPEFAKGVIDDWKYEFKYLGYVPNSNRLKIGNRSQVPVAALAYRAIESVLPDTEENRAWKRDTINFLKSEYFNAWVNDPVGEAKYNHYERYNGGHSDVWVNQTSSPTGLAQYSDADLPANHENAECASGEDYSPRFGGKCGNFNPTDLQGHLGIYEKLFAETAETDEERAHWQSQFDKRKKLVNDLMWNEKKGWFMDYDFVNKKQSNVMAISAFVIALAGMASKDQLDRMVQNLDKFKLNYGLAMTTGEEGENPSRDEQWKHPNVWSPREDLVLQTLMEHPEYDDVTEDIIIRSMVGCAEFHDQHESLPETRDGNTGSLGGKSWYKRDSKEKGFMWTNVEYLNNERRLKELYARRDQLALAA